MMRMKFVHAGLAFAVLVSLNLVSCKGGGEEQQSGNTEEQPKPIAKPGFNADSAYAYIEKQVAFGPRVPNTPAQKACAAWMESKLKEFTDTVYVQNATVKAGDGKSLPCINLIGAINPSATKRILLLAHWDTRPWADMDVKDKDKPILGADDAGSGVAVLLELARQIKTKPLPANLGIDILFTDVEDYGKSEWDDREDILKSSYALGTQYWARNPHVPGYKAEFGILLDMVGARDAIFFLEGYSTQFAGSVQQEVWRAAGTAGYSSFFPFSGESMITDDHVFVNKMANIPTVDIINLNTKTQSGFAPHWHTHNDNMSIIDRQTLKAVGETLLQVIYQQGQSS